MRNLMLAFALAGLLLVYDGYVRRPTLGRYLLVLLAFVAGSMAKVKVRV